MVQLKDIPCQDCMRVREISIPYGSIKRSCNCGRDTFAPLFQFLMVQLKGFANSIDSIANSISIPYGSIKSS